MNNIFNAKSLGFAAGFTVLLAGLLLLCGQPAFAALTTPI